MFEHEAESRRRVGHRVCAVENDEGVIGGVLRENVRGYPQLKR